ncbi:MAG: FAD:protein FMN transferase [Jatrophihabitantaceae bacterium]
MSTQLASRRRVEHCMGTVFSFDVRAPGVEEPALDEAVRWLHQVDETFSTYRGNSEISRLARGELAGESCSPQVRAVLARCEELRRDTGGYFSARPAGTLDPSGYVKGWAIERASDILLAAGSRNHCVNGGGDVQCVGQSAPGRSWRIGIAHPHRRDELAGVVAGAPDAAELAVATSGSVERGCHVLDPHTGRGVDGLASVTVVGARLADADAYATAAFAMGPAARAWLERLPGYWGFGVRPDGSTWTTTGWGRADDD